MIFNTFSVSIMAKCGFSKVVGDSRPIHSVSF